MGVLLLNFGISDDEFLSAIIKHVAVDRIIKKRTSATGEGEVSVETQET